jgi:hypothetical protein
LRELLLLELLACVKLQQESADRTPNQILGLAAAVGEKGNHFPKSLILSRMLLNSLPIPQNCSS